MDENLAQSTDKSRHSTSAVYGRQPLKLMEGQQQTTVLLGVVKLLKGICGSSKPTDGEIVDDGGQLNMLGKFWRSSLGEFSLEDFGIWRKALESRKVLTPDWFPPVRDIWDQIALARDLDQIGEDLPPGAPEIKLLSSETGHDHLRARTTGGDPAYGPMKTELVKREEETSEEYANRMRPIVREMAGGGVLGKAVRNV